MACGVYKITCTSNNKIYIGSSKNIFQRWQHHRWALKNNKHVNYYFQNDWNKYGSQNFSFEILEECLTSEQYLLEQEYLDKLQPFYKLNKGYNINEIAMPYGKSILRFVDYDEFRLPHYVKEIGCKYKMHITDDDYFNKTKEELQKEYDGEIAMSLINDSMCMCDPDYAE